MSRIDEIKRQIGQLDELIKSGVLSEQAGQEARTRLETELGTLGVDASSIGEPGAADTAKTKAPMGLLLGIAGFVVVFAAGSYALLGNKAGLSVAPAPEQAASAAENAAGPSAHATTAGQIEAMIARLEERMKTTPNDVEGWAMLGRSYSAVGKHAESLQAHRKIIEINPKDAQAYADLADAMGSANGRSLDGEPEQLIAKSLKLDPDNVKALALSGTMYFNRGDAKTAAKHWEHALRFVDVGGPMATQLEGAVAQARERAGMPALAPVAKVAAAATAAAQPAPAAAGAGGSIQGRVTLSDKLKAQASPEDTVFIFARAMQGGKAPLAIIRKQVKDLPFEFTLDDSQAMSPAMRLSSATEVKVGARISKSGNAISQPGDMQGLTDAVAVGAKGVNVEISETIR